MRRNMAISLLQHGAIRTTVAKAKEIRPFVEKLITMARKNTVHARRVVSAELGNRRGERGLLCEAGEQPGEKEVAEKGILQKLFEEIAPRYAERPGGYTRIIRLSERRIGDAGKQVVLQLVEETSGEDDGPADGGRSRRRKRAEKRHEAVEEAASGDATTEATEERADDAPTEDAAEADGEEAPKDE